MPVKPAVPLTHRNTSTDTMQPSLSILYGLFITYVTLASAAPLYTRASDIGDFGSCSIPQIKFGVGFDNRKETSFEPVDLGTQAICHPSFFLLFFICSNENFDAMAITKLLFRTHRPIILIS